MVLFRRRGFNLRHTVSAVEQEQVDEGIANLECEWGIVWISKLQGLGDFMIEGP